jgi:hypothetical protein
MRGRQVTPHPTAFDQDVTVGGRETSLCSRVEFHIRLMQNVCLPDMVVGPRTAVARQSARTPARQLGSLRAVRSELSRVIGDPTRGDPTRDPPGPAAARTRRGGVDAHALHTQRVDTRQHTSHARAATPPCSSSIETRDGAGRTSAIVCTAHARPHFASSVCESSLLLVRSPVRSVPVRYTYRVPRARPPRPPPRSPRVGRATASRGEARACRSEKQSPAGAETRRRQPRRAAHRPASGARSRQTGAALGSVLRSVIGLCPHTPQLSSVRAAPTRRSSTETALLDVGGSYGCPCPGAAAARRAIAKSLARAVAMSAGSRPIVTVVLSPGCSSARANPLSSGRTARPAARAMVRACGVGG